MAQNTFGDALSGAASGAAIGSVVPVIGTAIGAVGGGLISLFGNLIGNAMAAGDQKAAMDYALQAQKMIMDQGGAPDMAADIVLKPFAASGELTPEMLGVFKSAGLYVPTKYEAISMNPDLQKQYAQTDTYSPEQEEIIEIANSKAAGVKTDESSKNAQIKALQSLQQRAEGGLSAGDRASLNQISNKVAGDAQSRLNSIRENMAMTGQGGAGADIAMQLQAAQQAANTENQAGMDITAQAQENALAAISQAGNLGGNMRTQQFSEDSDRARAEDMLNQFNTQNSIGRQTRNVANINTARQANLEQQQRIADANVRQYNEMLNQDLKNKQNISNLNTGEANTAATTNLSANQAISNANVHNVNQAAVANFNRGNDVSDANTRLFNTDSARKLAGQQQNFNMNNTLLQNKAGALNNLANISSGKAAQTQHFASGVGNAVGGMVKDYAAAQINNNAQPQINDPDAAKKIIARNQLKKKI